MGERADASRPPLERIFAIHKQVQAGRFPNCPGLARMFEVHSRTIERDIEFMRDRLNLPIDYDARHRGFFYTRPVEHFPLLPITEAEMFALLVAHKAIAQYQGTPFEQPLNTAFKKLTGQLDQSDEYSFGGMDELLSFRPLAPEITDAEKFRILTRALQEKKTIRFNYRNLGERTQQQRVADPYHVACINNHWYLFAFDVQRRAVRTFAVTRLSGPEFTGHGFTISEGFNLQDYLSGAFTVFKGTGDCEVVIDFDPWATDLIKGRRWHPTQEITDLPQGHSRMRLHLSSIEEMVGWVLSWGAHAKVVRPRTLLRRVHEAAAQVAAVSKAALKRSPEQ